MSQASGVSKRYVPPTSPTSAPACGSRGLGYVRWRRPCGEPFRVCAVARGTARRARRVHKRRGGALLPGRQVSRRAHPPRSRTPAGARPQPRPRNRTGAPRGRATGVRGRTRGRRRGTAAPGPALRVAGRAPQHRGSTFSGPHGLRRRPRAGHRAPSAGHGPQARGEARVKAVMIPRPRQLAISRMSRSSAGSRSLSPEERYGPPVAGPSGEESETLREELPMSKTNFANWIRGGLLALPVYGLLTFWSTLDPQPDQNEDPEAWARFVSTPSYLVSHLFGSIGGTIFAILGIFALGAYLANSRTGRLGMVAMVTTVLGQALFLVIGCISTFATPAIGRAYLEGTKDVMQVEFPSAMMLTFPVGRDHLDRLGRDVLRAWRCAGSGDNGGKPGDAAYSLPAGRGEWGVDRLQRPTPSLPRNRGRRGPTEGAVARNSGAP